MRFKQTIGICLIACLSTMAYLIVNGILFSKSSIDEQTAPEKVATQGDPGTPPTITLSADPSSVSAGQYAVLSWSVSGQGIECTASGDWKGKKTLLGTMSTGKLSSPKTYQFKLSCENSSGSSEKNVSVEVK